MVIHPDIKKAIEIIDQRINGLQNIREALAKEFGMEDVVKPSVSSEPETPLLPLPLNGNSKKTRKQVIAEYLALHGPTRRTQISSDLGIPNGTVSYALNDKKTFQRTSNGKWELVSQEKIA